MGPGSYSFGLSALGLEAPSQVLPTANVCHPRKAPRTRRQDVTAVFPVCLVRISAVTKLYVGNLPFTATDESVRALFSKHGSVEKVSMITDRDTGRPRGFG